MPLSGRRSVKRKSWNTAKRLADLRCSAPSVVSRAVSANCGGDRRTTGADVSRSARQASVVAASTVAPKRDSRMGRVCSMPGQNSVGAVR